jgi:hypothetical protein
LYEKRGIEQREEGVGYKEKILRKLVALVPYALYL